MAKNDTTSTKALIVALLGALGTALTVVTSPTNTTGATAVIAVFLSVPPPQSVRTWFPTGPRR